MFSCNTKATLDERRGLAGNFQISDIALKLLSHFLNPEGKTSNKMTREKKLNEIEL